jgi:protocatechuate 3,4-dioxygenase beta subunit
MRRPRFLRFFRILLPSLVSSALLFFSSDASPARQVDESMPSDTGTASIGGHIFRSDNKAPMAGVSVVLSPMPSQGSLVVFARQQIAVTGTDGAYIFQSLPAGDYFIQAESSGFVSGGHRGAVSIGVGEMVSDADITLDLAGAISGSVYDQDGDPLEGMEINLFYTSFADGPGPHYRVVGGSDAVTDDEGNFQIHGMMPGKCYVVASTVRSFGNSNDDRTYYPSASSRDGAKLVEMKAGGETTGIRITLPQSLGSIASPRNPNGAHGGISGNVYRADSGAPLGGAVVFLSTIPDMRNALKNGVPEPVPAVIARTDANGAYEFRSLAAGRYMVSARRPGFLKAYLSPRKFARGFQQIEVWNKRVTKIDGRLQTAGAITGTVTDTSGQPIPGMMVSIVRRAASRRTEQFDRLASEGTDEQGRYRALVAAPGDYYVTAAQQPAGFRVPVSSYARVYYPHGASPAQAQTIHVDPSAPSTINLQLAANNGPTYTVTVHIVADKKEADQYHTVWFEEGGDDVQAFLPGLNLSVLPIQYAAPGDVVQFRGVHPGRFIVGVGKATIVRGADGKVTSASGGMPNQATATVEVANADVNVELLLHR